MMNHYVVRTTRNFEFYKCVLRESVMNNEQTSTNDMSLSELVNPPLFG